MAFELPTLPFPKDATGTPYIASPDASGKYTVASGQWFKNASNLWVPVSAADPLPTIDNDVKALLTSIQGYVDGLEAALGEVSASPTAYTVLSRLKDLADRLGEVSASPTANTMLARLKTLEGYLDGVEVALGTQTDAEATGDGSLIAIIKRLRTLVGQGIVTLGSAIGTTGLLMAGSDGTNARAIKTASDGTVLTRLTSRKLAVRKIVATDTSSIAAAASKTIVVYPSANTLARVKQLHVSFTPQGTTGNYDFVVYVNSFPGGRLLQLQSTYNTDLTIDCGLIVSGGNVAKRPDVTNLLNVYPSMVFTNASPLFLFFYNNTDVAFTNTRTIEIMVEEENII